MSFLICVMKQNWELYTICKEYFSHQLTHNASGRFNWVLVFRGHLWIMFLPLWTQLCQNISQRRDRGMTPSFEKDHVQKSLLRLWKVRDATFCRYFYICVGRIWNKITPKKRLLALTGETLTLCSKDRLCEREVTPAALWIFISLRDKNQQCYRH